MLTYTDYKKISVYLTYFNIKRDDVTTFWPDFILLNVSRNHSVFSTFCSIITTHCRTCTHTEWKTAVLNTFQQRSEEKEDFLVGLLLTILHTLTFVRHQITLFFPSPNLGYVQFNVRKMNSTGRHSPLVSVLASS